MKCYHKMIQDDLTERNDLVTRFGIGLEAILTQHETGNIHLHNDALCQIGMHSVASAYLSRQIRQKMYDLDSNPMIFYELQKELHDPELFQVDMLLLTRYGGSPEKFLPFWNMRFGRVRIGPFPYQAEEIFAVKKYFEVTLARADD